MKKMDIPEVDYEKGDDAGAAFREIVRTKGDQTALVFKDRRITWSDLGSRVNRVANALMALGITNNDRVAILSRNSVEYVELFFGALSAGACAVPLPTMASPDALKLMIEDSAPRVMAVSDEFLGHVAPFVETFDFLVKGGKIGIDFDNNAWGSYGDWVGSAPDSIPDVKIDKDNEFNIIYSSGTTGVPKGITHTHGIRKAFGIGLKEICEAPDMVNIISTPLYSNTTMVTWLSSMRYGTPCVLMEKFDARKFLALCEREKASMAMLVPVQYDRILRVEDFDSFDLSSMLVKFSTSAPLLPELKRQILDRFPGELVEFYGLTEGGVSTVFIGSENQDRLDSVGQPSPGCEAKIIDEQGRELETGQIGEIVGRQAYMMTGYQNREDATNEMLWYDEEGKLFFRSGDIGRMDEDGFLYVLDRKKDVIISGGFNVFAIDLEKEFLKHGAVRDVAVIGVPSEAWGETPLAFVMLEKGADETPERLLEWVNTRLGKGQRISKVEIIDEIPKSSIGKTLKKELRKPYWEKP